MTPEQRVTYLELKKKYGYDIAVLKQNSDPLSEDELFKSLLLFHVQNLITNAINEYAQAVEGAPEELSTLVTVLFNTTGEIIGNIAGQNPAYLLICKDIALKQFNSHLKDLINVRPESNPLS